MSKFIYKDSNGNRTIYGAVADFVVDYCPEQEAKDYYSNCYGTIEVPEIGEVPAGEVIFAVAPLFKRADMYADYQMSLTSMLIEALNECGEYEIYDGVLFSED